MIKPITTLLLLSIMNLWAGEAAHELKAPQGIVGGAITLKADFDIYKIQHGHKRPYVYSYMIMPAPEISIGGHLYKYLGRMPAGTVLRVTSFESSKGARKGEYRAKPLSPIDDRIKGNVFREVHQVEERLEEQIFKLRGMEVRIGVRSIYGEGRYPDGAPKLNETWFEIIAPKDIQNEKATWGHLAGRPEQPVSSESVIREELPAGTSFSITTDFWAYKIKGQLLRQGLPRVKGNNYTINSDRGGGIGGLYLSYVTTFPAGTRFEVVSLIKKNNRKWFYIVRAKDYTDPEIGEASIVIHSASMLKVSWGRRGLDGEYMNSKTTQLDPDLFADFHYPDE